MQKIVPIFECFFHRKKLIFKNNINENWILYRLESPSLKISENIQSFEHVYKGYILVNARSGAAQHPSSAFGR